MQGTLRDPQPWNRYAYARNSPLIYTDPDGWVIESLFEVVSRGLTLRAAWRDPSSKPNWASLAVDAASVAIPGMPATATRIRIANTADNRVDVVKAVENEASRAKSIVTNKRRSPRRSLNPVRGAFRKKREAWWRQQARTTSSNYSQEDLERMKTGQPPIGSDSHPVELHHRDGIEDGGVVEILRTEHRPEENYRETHSPTQLHA